jgi:hypothetical protein
MTQGDQIYVMQKLLNLQGFYEHHGIDYGDGTVIHYRKGTETIERTSQAEFTKGQLVYVKHYVTSFTPDVVLHRAESRLGEHQYNLLFNNCEHFATWCKTGVSYSTQIQDFIPFMSQIDPEQLSEPIAQALQDSSRVDKSQVLNQALNDIKKVWDDLQPQYNQAVREVSTWHQVAQLALKQGKEETARAAVQRKLGSKKRVSDLKSKLDHLATMTETLIRNSQQIY